MPTIKVILGSTRPSRFGEQPANWLMELAKEHSEATFELVDLKEIDLPMLDEAVPALYGNYANDHTKAWSKIIGEADGFVIVTGEYNFSIPAALKNAIDYLAAEWRYKPVAFIGYGASAGGARAIAHLQNVAANVGWFDLRDSLTLVNYFENLDDQQQYKFTDGQAETAHKLLNNVAFWADKLKPIREEIMTGK